MFERFTDRARRVLVHAQEEARILGTSFIGTEHILLGLIDEGEGVAAKALENLDISIEAVRGKVEETIGPVGSSPTGSPPFTPRAKKVLEFSLREALQMGHNYIGTEHMLLGILREGEGAAAQILVELGAGLDDVRYEVLELIQGFRARTPAAAVTQRVTGRPVRLQAGLVACSFCGREPPQTGRLVSGNDAFICEHCVVEWGRIIENRDPGNTGNIGGGVSASVFTTSHEVQLVGPPPEDEERAREEIAASFAAHDETSGDGRSLTMVERGENLGPLAGEARERHRSVVPEGSEVAVTVDRVAFTSSENAVVWFSIAIDGRSVLSNHRGHAVVEGGRWKMSRHTFCDLMSMAGVQCPPEAS